MPIGGFPGSSGAVAWNLSRPLRSVHCHTWIRCASGIGFPFRPYCKPNIKERSKTTKQGHSNASLAVFYVAQINKRNTACSRGRALRHTGGAPCEANLFGDRHRAAVAFPSSAVDRFSHRIPFPVVPAMPARAALARAPFLPPAVVRTPSGRPRRRNRIQGNDRTRCQASGLLSGFFSRINRVS